MVWVKVAQTPHDINRGREEIVDLPIEDDGQSDEEILTSEWAAIKEGRVKRNVPTLRLLSAPVSNDAPLEAVRQDPAPKVDAEAFQIHMGTYLRLNGVFADLRNPVNGLLVARHGDDWCFGAGNAHVAVLWGAFAVFGQSREPAIRAHDWSTCNSLLGPKLAEKHGFGRLALDESEGKEFRQISQLVRKLLNRALHGEEATLARSETLNVRNLQKALTVMGLVAGAEVRVSLGCGPALLYNREKDVIAIVTASAK